MNLSPIPDEAPRELGPQIPAEPAREEVPVDVALISLALEHGEPVTCGCGATWNTERALSVVARCGLPAEQRN